MDTRDLTVRINGDASSYKKAVSEVGASNNEVESSFGKLTKAFVFGNVLYSVGANVAVRFKDALTSVIDQANEAARTQAQLNAVIQSTGGVAGVTAESAKKLSEVIRDHTAIDDTAVLSAENMLLTFRDIGKNVFPAATHAVTDMATAMNGGAVPSASQLRDTAIQVGKALQDPIKGVTTLRRVGVQLSDQQQQQIKDFIAVGDKASAQRVILDELSKEFGGAASATAETFSGKMQQLKNRMDDFGKSVVLNIEGSLTRHLPDLENFAGSVGRLADKVWNFLKPSFDAIWNSITQKLMPALMNFWKNVVEPLIPVIGTLLVGAVWAVINMLDGLIKILSPAIEWMGKHRDVVYGVAGAYALLKTSMMLGAAFDAIKVGVATLQLVTFPSMIASIGAVSSAWVVAFPIAGILADIALVADAIHTVIQTWQVQQQMRAGIAEDNKSQSAAIDQMKGLAANGSSAQQQRARKALHGLGVAGYATGGFTGPGATNEIAGVVHKGEFVIPKAGVDQNTGMPKGGGNTFVVNVGMYAGMPVEKRQIALELYKELVRAARAQGVQMQMIGAMSPQ